MVHIKKDKGKIYAVDFNFLTGKSNLTVDGTNLSKVSKKSYIGNDESGNVVNYYTVGNSVKGINIITPNKDVIEVITRISVFDILLYFINIALAIAYFFFNILTGFVASVLAMLVIVALISLRNTRMKKGVRIILGTILTAFTVSAPFLPLLFALFVCTIY